MPQAFRWVLAAILLGALPTLVCAQDVLRGFVRDADDGQVLQGATVMLRRPGTAPRGTVTDVNGFFRIGGVPAGRYALRITYIGYRAFTDTLMLEAGAPPRTLDVRLAPATEALGEVLVAEEAPLLEGGVQIVRPTDLRRIPTPDLSGDLASYLQTLPGIIAVGDRGGQLFVRGGTPAQNLVLMDGLAVFQPFHIVGFFSAFPDDLVASASVYAGGFGARYSGRLSSVIDVTMRSGNQQRVEAAASVSPFLASARLEGPITRGASGFLVSARTSLIDRTAPRYLGRALPFRFNDVYAKLHRTNGDNGQCSLSALTTYDRGGLAPEQSRRSEVFRWRNLTAGARCLVLPTHKPVLFNLVSGVSYTSNDVIGATGFGRTSAATRMSLAFDLTYFRGSAEISGGGFTHLDQFTYTLGSQFTGIPDDAPGLFNVGGYVEAKLPLAPRLTATPGLALLLYPGSYRPGVEPRLRLAWQPAPATALHAATGWYRQVLTGLTDERDIGSAFLAWVPSPLGDRQATAWHALAGIEQRLPAGLRLAVEGYRKHLRDLAVPRFEPVARFTTALVRSEGETMGLDARLEFQRQPVYAFLGYGYARTLYTAQQGDFGAVVGRPVRELHPPHDRRHQLNAVVSVEGRRRAFTMRWQFGSGLPYTQIFGFDDVVRLRPLGDLRAPQRIPRLLVEEPFGARLPAFHRLDVSAEQRVPLRTGQITVQAGVINAYDQRNLFYFDLFTGLRADQLPLVPYAALRYETR